MTKLRRGGGLGVSDVIGADRTRVLDALRANHATRARVFGSVGRGTATERSDLDLIVEFEPGASMLDQVGLAQNLEDILRPTVEVTTSEGLHWLIRPQVLFEAVPL